MQYVEASTLLTEMIVAIEVESNVYFDIFHLYFIQLISSITTVLSPSKIYIENNILKYYTNY